MERQQEESESFGFIKCPLCKQLLLGLNTCVNDFVAIPYHTAHGYDCGGNGTLLLRSQL